MLKKISRILAKGFILLLVLSVVVCTVAQVRKYRERNDVKPLGRMIEVDNKKIHVYSVGRGKKTIVDETRTALKKAKIDGPYVLMPHSISGVYAEYYTAAYPREDENCFSQSDKKNLVKMSVQNPYIYYTKSKDIGRETREFLNRFHLL